MATGPFYTLNARQLSAIHYRGLEPPYIMAFLARNDLSVRFFPRPFADVYFLHFPFFNLFKSFPVFSLFSPVTPSYVNERGSFGQAANILTNLIWRDSTQRSIIIADKIRAFNCKCCETLHFPITDKTTAVWKFYWKKPSNDFSLDHRRARL